MAQNRQAPRPAAIAAWRRMGAPLNPDPTPLLPLGDLSRALSPAHRRNIQPALEGAREAGRSGKTDRFADLSDRQVGAIISPALTPTSPGYCAPIMVNPSDFLDARSLVALQTDTATNNSGGGAVEMLVNDAGIALIGTIGEQTLEE